MNKSDLKLIAVLERTGGFASAQELHQILRREGDGIGLTTVYRALQSLVDDKIVDLLRRDDGEAIYRLCGDTHHHHLVCKGCGDTVEIEGGAIEKWAKTMAEEFGFREVGHTAEIFGICSKCQMMGDFRGIPTCACPACGSHLMEITASFSPDTYEIEMYLLDSARCAMCQACLTAPTPIDHPAA